MEGNKLKLNKYIIFFIAGLLLVFIILLAIKKTSKSSVDTGGTVDVSITDGAKTVEAKSSGGVSFKFGSVSYFQQWGRGEIVKLLKYLKSKGIEASLISETDNYYVITLRENGGTTTLYISKNDPYLNDLFEGIGGGGTIQQTPQSTSVFDFSTSSPYATQKPTKVPTPAPTYVPTYQMPENCPLWLLSICIYPRKKLYPSPSPTIVPLATVVPDCRYWEKKIFGKAIISGTYCVKTP